MHEYGILKNLYDIILKVAEEEQLKKIKQVKFVIGEMIQIVPALFKNAFEVVSKGSIAEGAALEIEIMPVKMQCTDCNAIYVVKDGEFNCENCGSFNIEMIQGKELYVKSLEGDK